MVICLERGADLHTAQLMPLPLTVCCFSKIQIGFTFLVPVHLSSPGKRAVCVCACVAVTAVATPPPPPIGERSIVMTVSVCLSVCLSVREHVSRTTRPILTELFVHVSYVRGSVLVRRRCDTFCISGFVDDVVFAHYGLPWATG